MFPIVFLLMIGAQALPNPAAACAGAEVPTGAGGVATNDALDADQMQVAQQIVAAVRAFLPTSGKPHAAVIALATARQESVIRNLDYGDADSLGAFQQRPSQGWGTPAQVTNVPHATTTFLEHLVRIPGWETRRVTDVAAEVQRPAAEYRGLYEQWVPLATKLTRQLWPQSASLMPTTGTCAGVPNPPPGPGDARAMARAQSWVDERVPYSQGSLHTNEFGTYRQDCSGYVSLVWGLPTSFTTASLPSVAHPISKGELRAGDIMLRAGHTLIFDRWANPSRTSYWAYEQERPGRVAVHHVVPYPYWPGQVALVPHRKG
ncbi:MULTISPECIES: hypothetical protein [unclassified Nocardioides]|uniref:hypothetical protein n=1 Tax=unclassified Nocardioides TaxID=2615069 RepID=UPI0012E36B4F|nr:MULTISPECIES: hypothetical protein [unclassified Nocardioides]